MDRYGFDGHSIFIYKLTVDNGGAPCVDGGILSLAICKPDIRGAASEGDWIVGFGGRSVPELSNRLIYVAKVAKVLQNGEYYKQREYRNRPDCIYEWDGSRYSWCRGEYHKKGVQREHDLGKEPSYDRATVLLSSEFVYRGGAFGPSIEPVKGIYAGLPRNFVRNHDPETRKRMEHFIASVMTEYAGRAPGNPTHGDKGRRCNDDALLVGCEGTTLS